jgi:mRNA interferase MazF
MKQKEIWNVYFDPIVGSEQAGNRPAVVVSGNLMNNNFNVILVCPISSSIKEYKGHPILEPNLTNGLKKKSEVMVFHVRSLSKLRFKKKIGEISNKELEQINTTLNKILKY